MSAQLRLIGMIAAAACAANSLLTSPADARMPTRRDAEDYVIASCLIGEPSEYLRGQGFGLASIVINRSGSTPADWVRLNTAVKAQLASQPMVTVHGDGPVGSDTPMPVARCLDLLRAPAIVAAIRRQLQGAR